jgi:hypothetical protein
MPGMTGDILKIVFDPEEKMIHFKNLNKNTKFSMKATGYNDGDDVYPCAVCYAVSESAEFVDYSFIEKDEEFI